MTPAEWSNRRATCECGTEIRVALLSRHRAACLGPRPTLEDLYRVGRVVVTEAGCHEWGGTRDADGYGVLPKVARAQLGERRASRAAFVLDRGAVPEGLRVLHSCDNPPCVRPEHLRAGTQAENMADKVSRGRHRR